MRKDVDNILCGILFVHYNSILLVHTTGKKEIGNYSIPKGHMKVGEKRRDCAIREVYEETGIKINRNDLGKRYKVDKFNDNTLYYYIYEITDLKKIGLKNKIIDKKFLQLTEIDWAGFVTMDKAMILINPSQKSILENYINIQKDSKYIINYDNYTKLSLKQK